MLYGPNGAVVRSADRTIRADRQYDVERDVRAKLKSIDELLDIVYVEWAGRYALMVKWPQSDARWELYHKGDISDCHDSLGWFCEDMQDPMSLPVSIDSIENKVLERLASCDNTIAPWKSRMAQIIDKNAKLRRERKQLAVDQAGEVAATMWDIVGKHDDHKVEQILDEISRGAI